MRAGCFPAGTSRVFAREFQLTAVVPNDFMAVSNMPIEEEKKTDAGKEVRFG